MRYSARQLLRLRFLTLLAAATCALSVQAQATDAPDCEAFPDLDSKSASPEQKPNEQRPAGDCKTQVRNGFPIPDPKCTPGAINTTLTADVLRDPRFRTSCVRDNLTTAQEKTRTYSWYRITHPDNNRGVTQTCELDHLISLELGGADSLENIWPQCGPSDVVLRERFFKQKDAVENYLAKQVREGRIKLKDAQEGISRDWTQYLEAAKACQRKHCPDEPNISNP